MSKGGGSHFKNVVYAKLAGAEWVRASVRVSGSTERAMRKAEGENAINAPIYNVSAAASSPPRKRVKRESSSIQKTSTPVVSMRTVVMSKELSCVVCSAPTPTVFLAHAANPYWLVCNNCIKA